MKEPDSLEPKPDDSTEGTMGLRVTHDAIQSTQVNSPLDALPDHDSEDPSFLDSLLEIRSCGIMVLSNRGESCHVNPVLAALSADLKGIDGKPEICRKGSGHPEKRNFTGPCPSCSARHDCLIGECRALAEETRREGCDLGPRQVRFQFRAQDKTSTVNFTLRTCMPKMESDDPVVVAVQDLPNLESLARSIGTKLEPTGAKWRLIARLHGLTAKIQSELSETSLSPKQIASAAAELETTPEDISLLGAALSRLGEGFVVADQNGRFQLFNQEAERILGIGPVDVPPADWTEKYGCFLPDRVTPFPPEDLPLACAIRGEEVVDRILFIRNSRQPNGVWISVTGSPLWDTDGLLSGGVVVIRDITALRAANERAERLASAVEQTADSVLITNLEGIIQYVNPAFEETTGYSGKEAIGQTPRILKSGKHDRPFYESVWRQIKSGEAFRGTVVNRKKSGQLYWGQQTITPIRDSAGRITHYVSVMKDVTELIRQKEMESQLALAAEVQERYYRVSGSFPGIDLAVAVHPADKTGGDYFDFLNLPDGSLGVAIGDVSGHGLGSALVMAEARAYLRAFANTETDIGLILTRVNRALAQDLAGGRFVTLTFVSLNQTKRVLNYASAGHVSSYLLRSSGESTLELESTGPPLGLFKDLSYETSAGIALAPGDVIVLLTDGILETQDPSGNEFGTQRTIEYLEANRSRPAREMAEGICQHVAAFAEDQPQGDDVTVVACRALPA